MNSVQNLENDVNANLLNLIEYDNILITDCKYLDLSECPIQNNAIPSIKIGHLNIHSIPSKYEDLIDIFDTMHEKNLLPDIMLLCETFLCEKNYKKYQFKNYNSIHKYRKNRNQGGVTILIRDNLKFNERQDLHIFEEGKFESVFVEISCKSKDNIIIGEIYRVPGTNEKDFLSTYESIVNKVKDERKKLIIGTDQNLDYLKINNHRNTMNFFELNLSNNLLPTICKPTRITHNSATLIDNIYVDAELGNCTSYILTNDISDHLFCLTVIHNHSLNHENREYMTRKLNDSNIRNIKGALYNNNWDLLREMNVNDASELLNSRIKTVIDFYAPLKTYIIKTRYEHRDPWFTKGLKNSSIKCMKKYKAVMHLPHNSNEYESYKIYRNMYNKIRRKAKSSYLHKLIVDNRNNSKKLWGILNKILGKTKNKKDMTDEMIVNGVKESNSKAISDAFGKYYSEIGKNMSAEIDKKGPVINPVTYENNHVNQNCFFFPTNSIEIERHIKSLKQSNSKGFDGLSNNILKSIYPSILPALNIIFNKSIESGIFPECMKIAIVKPLYKAKSKLEICNYRPISLLPVISKILEKIIHSRLTNFFKKYNILYEGQYGFRKLRSTTDAILDLTGNILDGFNRNMYTIGLFLDMTKAFDSIKHDTLLKKLENYGIRGLTLNWIKSYLTGREISVLFNNVYSKKFKINYGTPQGSVLGPLLYSIIANDLTKCLKFSNCIMFADDTTVYISGKNINFLFKKLNEDLKKLTQWFNYNSLSLNTEKTSYILFKPYNKKPTIDNVLTINGKNILRVPSTKFLGVIIDEHLHWNKQTQNILLKLTSGIYSLNMNKNVLPISTKKQIYFTNIQSHISYALSVWGPMLSANDKRKLQVQQNKAVRSIFNVNRRSSIKQYFKKCNLLPIDDMIELSLAKISYRYINEILPKRISNLFDAPGHNHNTRHRNALQVPHHTLAIYNKSFLGRSPNVWLNLQENIKNSEKMCTFNKRFSKYKLSLIE